MSNRFYNYLSENLISFFNKNSLKPGDRFLINFDNKTEVKNFYNALKSESTGDFEYKYNENYDSYKTFYISFEDIDLVVADSSVTSDFLVTLRNQVSNLEDEWANKALLVISEDVKDSINEGMINLQDEGYPFNIDYIGSNLKSDIIKAKLSVYDSDILNVFLENISENSFYKRTIWDLKEVLSIINKGYIDISDYKGLDLFHDSGLESLSDSRSRKSRLKENMNLFLQIDDMVNFENFDKKIEGMFDNNGINELTKNNEDWFSADFKVLYGSMEEYKKKTKRIKYKHASIENNLELWDKPEKETSAMRRRRHVLVFNDSCDEIVSVTFTFDTDLKREFLSTKGSKGEISISKRDLNFKIKCHPSGITFKKYIYEHENVSKNRFEFSICIINCKSKPFENISSIYTIQPRFKKILLNKDEGYLLMGGGFMSEIVITDENSSIQISDNESININIEDSIYSTPDGILDFNIQYNTITVPFRIKELNTKTHLIRSFKVWNEKRITQSNFTFDGSTIKQDEQAYNIADTYFKQLLLVEEQMIENRILFGKLAQDKLVPEKIHIPQNILDIYEDIFSYYHNINNIPSLVYLDDNLKKIYMELIDEINAEIELIDDSDHIANSSKKDLLKLGVFKNNGRLMFSPLSPLNIAYQLEIYTQCGSDYDINKEILESLVPNDLLPYLNIVDDDVLYRPIVQDIAKEWIIYEESSEVSVGTTNQFIRQVVNEKLKQFVIHFNYLFKDNSTAPIKINLINIENDKEVVKGVFDFIRNRLPDKRKTGGIIPVEIHIYSNNHETKFNDLFNCRNEEHLEKYFDIKINSDGIDALDILRIVQENISYYFDTSDDFEYAHISFYNVHSVPKISFSPMDEIETGMSLGGLFSVTTSNPPVSDEISNHKDYRTGFGIKYANLESNLVRFAKNINEFSFNNKNNGFDPYRKGVSIVSMPDMSHENIMNILFEKSHWVTFIEPNFGLDYFADKTELFIIHYSDQYSSSSKYDTITVTNKSEQYMQIIKEFLENSNLDEMEFDKNSIKEVIRIFNSINGEWLLHIGLHDNQEREKLSVVSAIKYVLSIFNHEDIIWIPISMEEILRVAGNVGLKEKDGLFSVKNLIGDKKGNSYSDDLLLIGLNLINNELYFYPIEVKLGKNKSDVIKKAKNQIKGTSDILKSYLIGRQDSFRKKFYRNFFIQLFLSNAKKLTNNHIWDEKNFSYVNNFKEILLNDNYKISNKLESIIGIGAVISFKNQAPAHSAFLENNVVVIELPDSEGYRGIITPINEINGMIHGDKTNISPDKLLCNEDISILKEPSLIIPEPKPVKRPKIEKPDSNGGVVKIPPNVVEEPGTTGVITFGPDGKILGIGHIENSPQSGSDGGSGSDESSKIPDISEVRALIGTSKDSNKEIYWEFGNPSMGNRHMLIQGKSGQGKTYFIQRIVSELSNQKIPTLIIDYTNGFRKDKLEKEFIDNLGDNFKQFIVIRDKFPLNPFKRYSTDIGGEYIFDNDSAVASRFKSIMNSVFNFGDQQLNVIYESVIRGISKYDEDFDFNLLKSEIMNNDSGSAQSLLNRLNELFNNNPFEYDGNFDWSILDKRSSDVIVIQLTGLSRDIQKIVSEFILWDLWNYKLQHGSEDKPFAIVLDEAHNLDFSDGSPCRFILKEGRKFGWASIFATQSTKGSFSSDEINELDNVNEKIFFHPTDSSLKSILNTIAFDSTSKRIWESNLLNLSKGQCIVYAPLRDEQGILGRVKPYYVNVDSL